MGLPLAFAPALLASLFGALIINEDNTRFYTKSPDSEFTRDGLMRFVDDNLAGGKVSRLVFCVNGSRPNYPAKSVEPVWTGCTGNPDGTRSWPQKLKAFFDADIDPYAVLIARTREKGAKAYLSVRMNDLHGCLTLGSSRSDFWRTHPEYYRGPRRNPAKDRGAWTNYALDYVHPEVRAHYLGFIAETVSRYRPDGLELDFLRFPQNLTPGAGCELRGVLTDFLRNVRRRVGALPLTVRVPAARETRKSLGYDVAAWTEGRIVDEVVPCNMWEACDFSLDPRSCGGKSVPGSDFSLNGEDGKWNGMDYAAYCGWADAMYARGAKDLYLFNLWYLPRETCRQVVGRGLDPNTVAVSERRYVVSWVDLPPDGEGKAKPLPANDSTNTTFHVTCGRGLQGGKTVEVVIGLTQDREEVAPDAVLLNGQASESAPKRIPDASGYGVLDRTKSVWCYRVPTCALKSGENVVRVTGVGDLSRVSQINWVEVRVLPAKITEKRNER